MFSAVLFDLDGTLTDPFEGITGGVLYALEHLGYDCPPREELISFIGPPLFDEFKRRFGMDETTAHEAVRLYRVYYSQGGLFENRVIDGAPELLSSLRSAGKTVCLATSKPEPFARRILDHFALMRYFDFVGGATFDGSISTKADVVRLVLRETGADPAQSVLVGDRFHDIEGAHAAGIRCIAALTGFGSREEFARYGADFVAEDLAQVGRIILAEDERNAV